MYLFSSSSSSSSSKAQKSYSSNDTKIAPAADDINTSKGRSSSGSKATTMEGMSPRQRRFVSYEEVGEGLRPVGI
jgi:hypothetical protein